MIESFKKFIKKHTSKIVAFAVSVALVLAIAVSATSAAPNLNKIGEKITNIKSNITVALEEIDVVKAVKSDKTIKEEKEQNHEDDENLLIEELSVVEETTEEIVLIDETEALELAENTEETEAVTDEEITLLDITEASQSHEEIKTEPETETITEKQTEKETEPETQKPVPQTEVFEPTTVVQKEIMSKAEAQVLEILNRERALNGVKPLIMSDDLQRTAQIRVRELFVSFSHTRPNGESCYTTFPQGYNWKGENIAMGHKSPEQVMDGWMNSEGHRANILNPKFTHVGIGALCIDGKYCWIQCFGEIK